MSIDIKLFTEIKIYLNGDWYLFGTPKVQQDYLLFEVMGHPMGGEPKIPKLPPEDMSVLTRLSYNYDQDIYHFNFLDANGILILETWFEDYLKSIKSNHTVEHYWGWLFGNSWSDWIKNPKDYPSFIENIRFVYWFDRE